MRIHILDDDPFFLRLLGHQLTESGFMDWQVFDEPQDALQAMEDHALWPDLLFLDLQMPGMDGVEVLRNLAGLNYFGWLVLMSGTEGRILQTAQRVATSRGLQVADVLRKPIQQEQLKNILAAAAPIERTNGFPLLRSFEADELWQAIYGDELVVHYQPKIDIDNRSLVGVEALVRWMHPKQGLVYPDRFIELAESCGLMDELTTRVLRTALRDCHKWHDEGLDVSVAVNISASNLNVLGFPDVVQHLAREAGVKVGSLCLELTESMLAKDLMVSLDILTRLRLKGAGLSIDDFGTGHSSLGQLLQAPFNELKLDRSFVTGASEDMSKRAILEASLRMAKKLGMRSVAEGVETRKDWDLMKALGCDLAQGYFVSRPMPADQLLHWRAQWQDQGS
jgi:EAL domain-containing protein (putative c-di-GMP-specific phosphodiesterase class I)/ActR/RegA family two-component response regulator